MFEIFIYIYHQNDPNVGRYSIHGASGTIIGVICTNLAKELGHHLVGQKIDFRSGFSGKTPQVDM